MFSPVHHFSWQAEHGCHRYVHQNVLVLPLTGSGCYSQDLTTLQKLLIHITLSPHSVLNYLFVFLSVNVAWRGLKLVHFWNPSFVKMTHRYRFVCCNLLSVWLCQCCTLWLPVQFALITWHVPHRALTKETKTILQLDLTRYNGKPIGSSFNLYFTRNIDVEIQSLFDKTRSWPRRQHE